MRNLEKLKILIDIAQSDAEVVKDLYEEGLFDDLTPVKRFESLETDKFLKEMEGILHRYNEVENAIIEYNEGKTFALELGEELREIFNLK